MELVRLPSESARTRAVPAALCVCAAVGLIVTIAYFLITGRIAKGLDPERYLVDLTEPDPGRGFTRATGLPWPRSAKVVRIGDDHGESFFGDGESYLVFDADPETIETWLSGRAPWDAVKWQAGPVPREIAFHCRFGEKTTPLNDAPRPFETGDVVFAAKPRGPAPMPWHNGLLMVVDRAGGRVWVSCWDF